MIFKYYKENWVLSQVKSLLEKKNDSKKKTEKIWTYKSDIGFQTH